MKTEHKRLLFSILALAVIAGLIGVMAYIDYVGEATLASQSHPKDAADD